MKKENIFISFIFIFILAFAFEYKENIKLVNEKKSVTWPSGGGYQEPPSVICYNCYHPGCYSNVSDSQLTPGYATTCRWLYGNPTYGGTCEFNCNYPIYMAC